MRVRFASVMLLVFLLCGCDMFSSSEMFQKPEIPEQYNNLIRAVDGIMGDDFEYAEPVSGLNRQSLQLMDLNGDGIDEGIAFLRDFTDSYKAYIYIFRERAGEFEMLDIIEGPENTIYTVSYSNLLGIGNFEMIVEWGSGDIAERPLMAYTVSDEGALRILDIGAEQYTVSDIDQDGGNDFIAVTGRNGGRKAEIYRAKNGGMEKLSSVPLAENSGQVLRMKSGGASGVYIECAAENGGIITNLITSENGEIINAIPNGAFCATRAFCEDVNGDGIIEIPVSLTTDTEVAGTSKCYNWVAYTAGSGLLPKAFTYHSYIENWYISMPFAWSKAVKAERGAVRPGQIAVKFYAEEAAMSGAVADNEERKRLPIFTVYTLTGDMRHEFAAQSGRFIVHEREETVFAAEIHSENYLGTTVDKEFIKSNFKIRESAWISEILFA